MPADPLYLTPAIWLPAARQSAAAAIAGGLLTPEDAGKLGVTEVPVSEDAAAPQMAVEAGAAVIAAAGPGPDRIGLVLHAWTYYQGHDFWSPAHYVAARLGLPGAEAIGIQQMCNGGGTSVALAAARLAADPAAGAALVTTADRFCPPGFDRWSGDYGIAYGDGATALLVSRAPGPFELLSCVSVSAPELERMHRGADGFSDAPHQRSAAVSVRRTKKAFLEAEGATAFADRAGRAVRDVVCRALSAARLSPHNPDLRYLAVPRLGRSVLDQAYRPALTGLTGAGLLDFGTETGHLGAGDAAGNLAVIHSRAMTADGDVVVLLSAGAGFSWSCLVVRATPARAAQPRSA